MGDQVRFWILTSYANSEMRFYEYRTKGNTLIKLPFGIPMFGESQRDHCADCYFGSMKTSGYNKNNKCKIEYPSLPSVLRQVSHSAEIPVISFRLNYSLWLILDSDEERTWKP